MPPPAIWEVPSELGLAEPWLVTGCDFDSEGNKLVIKVGFERSTRLRTRRAGDLLPSLRDWSEYVPDFLKDLVGQWLLLDPFPQGPVAPLRGGISCDGTTVPV